MLNKYLLITQLFLILSFQSQSQNRLLLKKYDSIIGENNTSLNNGTLDLNRYTENTVDNQNKFYRENYRSGNILYDGKFYFDKELKYDLLNDVLLYNPVHSASVIGVDLINSKVRYFEIDNKIFVNLSIYQNELNLKNFLGYWQKIQIISPDFIDKNEILSSKTSSNIKNYALYIKRKKRKKEVIRNKEIFFEFDLYIQAYMINDANSVDLSDRLETLDLFPNLKAKINKFYSINDDLKKNKPVNYYRKLYELIMRNLEYGG